jgi:DNA polymerase-3 subunit alpha
MAVNPMVRGQRKVIRRKKRKTGGRFVHLHRHSEFSRLDGLGTASQYATLAASLGQFALSLTDHGTMSGALHHLEACKAAEIQAISGVEAYFRPDRAEAKEAKEGQAWHLVLMAKNMKGWKNLLKLTTEAYSEVEHGGGFYKYPAVDWELLEKYHEGIICTSACVSGWLNHVIKLGHDAEVDGYISRMKNLFGDDFWLEVMPHNFDEQRTLNVNIFSLGRQHSVGVVATNDAHFPYKEWADTHRIVKMMGSGSSFKKAEEDKAKGKAAYLSELNPTLYLCSEEEMYDWFEAFHPDLKFEEYDVAIQNTGALADSIEQFALDTSPKLPKVSDSPWHAEQAMWRWIKKGLRRIEARYPKSHWDKFPMQVYLDRIDFEIKVLKDRGVYDYFLMVADFIDWCQSDRGIEDHPNLFLRVKKTPIRIGCSRGSAGGCLISYLMGIVKIDPIPYDLLFERFLNPDRKGLPDVDIDIQSDKRWLGKEYIIQKYGRENVADIITHQRFQPKNVIQGLGRVFDLPFSEVKKVTDTIDIRQDSEETTVEELEPINDKLHEFLVKYPEVKKHALRLEGMVANAGKHAAGVIVTPTPIVENMGLERGGEDDLVTSWSDAADFAAVSDNGFVKMDFLGIKGLLKHEYACQLIRKRLGPDAVPNLNDMDCFFDPYAVDPYVMEGFSLGQTVGIFQFGSAGMTKLIKGIRPTSISDLAAANALYRPGPMKMGMTWEFASRKHNPMLRRYEHPDLKEYLEPTYGLIPFQENIMRIAGGIGRLTPGDTDAMRKAMGKLYRLKGDAAQQFMAQFESKFMEGAIEDHGWPLETAERTWQYFLAAGGYTFNKSHSEGYSLQAYQDMLLKRHFPHEFYCSFLTFEDEPYKVKAAVREAQKEFGIEVRLPLVNEAGVGVTTDGESLMLGLSNIKGYGPKSAKVTMRERPFKDLDDLLARGKSVPFRDAISAGACDDFLDRKLALAPVKKWKAKKEEWEDMLYFEFVKYNNSLKNRKPIPEPEGFPTDEYLESLQVASFTVPIKDSALNAEATDYIIENSHFGEEFEAVPDGQEVIVGGEIVNVELKQTKNGKAFANVVLDFNGEVWRLKFWEEALEEFGDLLQENAQIMALGVKNIWKDFHNIVVTQVVSVEQFFQEEEEEELAHAA